MANLLENITESYLSSETETNVFETVTENVIIRTTTQVAVAVLKEPELRTLMRYALVGWGTLIIGLFGLVGNTLSGIILIKRSMRSPLNLLLFFLTMWDGFLLITTIFYLSIPTIFTYLRVSRTLDYIWFPTYKPYLYALRCTGQLGSALFTLLVTSERYIAVCWPLHSRVLCNTKKSLLASAITSLIVILYNLPRFWDFETVQVTRVDDYYEGPNNGTDQVMVLAYEMQSTEFRCNKIYYTWYLMWGAFVTTSAIPFLFLSVFNYFICKALANFNKARRAMTNGLAQSKEISLTKMFVCVITVSLVASGLNLFLTVIDSFWVLDLSWQGWYVEKVVATFNSSVNCIFYCAFGTRFRQEFFKTFGCLNVVLRRNGGKGISKSLESCDTNCTNDTSSSTKV